MNNLPQFKFTLTGSGSKKPQAVELYSPNAKGGKET